MGQNKNNQLALESIFMTGYGKHSWKCTKSILDFTDFYYLPPSQLEVPNFEVCEWRLIT